MNKPLRNLIRLVAAGYKTDLPLGLLEQNITGVQVSQDFGGPLLMDLCISEEDKVELRRFRLSEVGWQELRKNA